MKLVSNTGSDRVLDHLEAALQPEGGLDVAAAACSVFGFEALSTGARTVAGVRLLLPAPTADTDEKAEVRNSAGAVPQGAIVSRGSDGIPLPSLFGSLNVTSEGLGLAPEGIVAWHGELKPAGDTTCVFRDSAFEDDVAKTNLAAILEQHGITHVRSL